MRLAGSPMYPRSMIRHVQGLVGGQNGGPFVAYVPGYQVNPSTTVFLTGSQVVPIVLPAIVVVPPAP